MVRITDKAFVYTPSYETNLRKKFRLIAARQRAGKAAAGRKPVTARPAAAPEAFISRGEAAHS